MSEPLVVLDNVVKRFGDFTETTTLRMLAGLEQPSAGEIRIGGRVMNTVAVHERDTPMVWQSLALFPFLNARENVEFGLKMRGVETAERRRRAMDWLGRLEIAEFAERNIETLSGGQRQRVALARSLVTEPRILLLDEPLSALDAHLVIRMQGVLTRLQRELGITFVYVTHSQSEAFAMANRVVILSHGEIAQTGKPRDIYRSPANRFVAEFVGRNNILAGTMNSSGDAIQTAIGDFPAAAPAGQAATLIVSADLVHISREAGPASIPCTLISEEFIGSVVTLFLEARDGTEFKVQLQERELGELDVHAGETLHLHWEPASAHVLTEGDD